MEASWLSTRSGQRVRRADIPVMTPERFHSLCAAACAGEARLAALCALPDAGGSAGSPPRTLLAVLADDNQGRLRLLQLPLDDSRSYPSLTPALPQAQAFERELFEQHAITPLGHPWLKPLRRHDDLEARASRSGGASDARPHPFLQVEGRGIHEVAVGPVHAGVIEPGHFRFQCHGEQVLSLEIQLGYQHRGAEQLLLRSPPARRLVVAESIAGDTAVGHALAYCTAMEALAGVELPLQAHILRGIALELERLANHVGDLGALCNDVGYLPGASFFGRLRGEFLNLLMELSGSRFGRGLLRPGGVRYGLDGDLPRAFSTRLARAERELRPVAEDVFNTPSVAARFDETGVVPSALALELGLVGPVARASGLDRDVRRDHPAGIFRYTLIPVAVASTGDVMARAFVRWLEIERSLAFVRDQLADLKPEPLLVPLEPPPPGCLSVALIESWRGELVHLALTGEDGQLAAYKIVDPSFHNWFGLAMALRGNQISDFPLCNKSFNLSYCGHDL